MRRLARRGACLALLLVLAATAAAEEKPLADPAAERRAAAIMRSIRCVVCQAQSIADSEADLAADLRRLVRELVAAGRNESEIEAYLAARYGEAILLRPPLGPATYLLWAGPFLLLAAGGAAVAAVLRRRRPAPPPLDAQESARLAAFLDPRRAGDE